MSSAQDYDHESAEPLIAREPHDNIHAGSDATIHDSSDTARDASNASAHNSFLYLLTLSAGISGILFGYDTGVISSTLITLDTSLGRIPSTWDKSLIASSTSLLALLASPISGHAADLLGRRSLIAIASVLFVAGALVQAAATQVWVMVLGRSIVGAAIGAASGVVPLYIAEIAPARSRGRLVTVQSLLITGGQVVAYLVGWAVRGRWRVAVGLGAAPAVVQGVLLCFTPESPRWLVMKGREQEARRVLERLGEGDEVEVVLRRIRIELQEEMSKGDERGFVASVKDLVQVPAHRRALTIACMLQGLQQLCGFNVLMYFSATIFTLVGFTNPVGTSLSIAGTNFLFTLAAFSIIDSIGRRRILLLSIPFMALALILCSICFLHLSTNTDPDTSITLNSSSSLFPYALLASLILYVSSYALGLGCVPWQQAELFPLRVRSLGSGLATATNWSGNFVVGISFLPMMQALGSAATFGCYALVCVVGWGLVWAIYPETMGLELEDVGRLLERGWGVRDPKGPGEEGRRLAGQGGGRGHDI